MSLTRRAVVSGLISAPALVLLPARPALAQPSTRPLALTPLCLDDGEATPASNEGPFYVPGSPRRGDLAGDVRGGDVLLVGGLVLDPRCRPVAGAAVALWQADQNGDYDRDGFRLRGHRLTDAEGRWSFRTIMPGLYPGRTRHLHVKVQRAGGAVLTTELFFPREPGNRTDRQFNARLLLAMGAGAGGPFGRYDFVIA